MKTKIAIILFFIIHTISAQKIESVSFGVRKNYLDKYDVPYGYLLSNNVNLRTKPSTKSNIVATLPIGKKLSLEEKTDSIYTINKVNAKWYKIKTKKYTGWLFGGFISYYSFGSRANHNVKFVSGINLDGTIQIRAFKKNKQLAKIDIDFPFSEIRWIKNLGDKGLTDVDDIITINIPCRGGCGCAADDFVIFWNGTSFNKAYKLFGTADAEASEDTVFIYPSDMEGIKNTIIEKSSEFLGWTDDKYQKAIRQLTTIYYNWDGEKLVKDTSRKTKVVKYTLD